MKRRLPKNLSPQLKARYLKAQPTDLIQVFIQIASPTVWSDLRPQLDAQGVRIGPWINELQLLSAQIPASHLLQVATLKGIVYIEADSRYSY